MGNIGIWQLLIVAVIVVLLFGTKKLLNMGGDLGSAVKGFKNAISDDKNDDKNKEESDKKEQASESIADKSAVEQKSTVKEKDQA